MSDTHGELGDQRVGRHAGEKHRRGCIAGVERSQDQILAGAVGCGARFRPEGARHAARYREDHAAAARGVGRNKWREHQIGCGQRIAQAERTAREAPHEEISDALTESGDGKRAPEQECQKDQPHRNIAEAGEYFRRGECSGEGEQRHGHHHACAHRQWLRHQRHDGRGEDGQQMALHRIQAGQWEQIEQQSGSEDSGPSPPAGAAAVE